MKLAVFAVLLVIVPFQAEAGPCIGKNVVVWVADGNRLTGDGPFYPDPYVVVTIGGDTQQTEVINENANPSWWTKMHFNNVGSDVITIDVWDSDSGPRGADDHLGTCQQTMVHDDQQYNNIHCDMDSKNGFVNVLYKCAISV